MQEITNLILFTHHHPLENFADLEVSIQVVKLCVYVSWSIVTFCLSSRWSEYLMCTDVGCLGFVSGGGLSGVAGRFLGKLNGSVSISPGMNGCMYVLWSLTFHN